MPTFVIPNILMLFHVLYILMVPTKSLHGIPLPNIQIWSAVLSISVTLWFAFHVYKNRENDLRKQQFYYSSMVFMIVVSYFATAQVNSFFPFLIGVGMVQLLIIIFILDKRGAIENPWLRRALLMIVVWHLFDLLEVILLLDPRLNISSFTFIFREAAFLIFVVSLGIVYRKQLVGLAVSCLLGILGILGGYFLLGLDNLSNTIIRTVLSQTFGLSLSNSFRLELFGSFIGSQDFFFALHLGELAFLVMLFALNKQWNWLGLFFTGISFTFLPIFPLRFYYLHKIIRHYRVDEGTQDPVVEDTPRNHISDPDKAS